MRRSWPIVVVVLVFAGLGLAKALRTSVGTSRPAVETQTRLTALPLVIGPWTGADVPYPEKQLAMANAEAHLYRTYTRNKPDDRVTILLMYGDSGSMGAHEPEMCFRGAGFKQCTTRTTRNVPGQPAEFWTASFETGSFPPSSSTLTWAWGSDGIWRASENPRFDFADRDRIFKLYVSRVNGSPEDRTDEFLELFVREFRRIVVDAPSGQDGT